MEGEAGIETTIGGSPVYLPESASELQQGYAGAASVGTVSPEQRAASEKTALGEELYGGAGQQVLTGIEGVASGVSFGLSDKLLNAAGAHTAERAEVNPGIRTATELGGAIVPGLLSGGTGLAGSLARTLPSGALVGRTSALASKIGGLTGVTVGSALEGAAFGAGQSVSKLALHDVPLTSEAGLTEIGMGTIFGAGAGAAGGALSWGAGKVAGKLEARLAKGAGNSLDELGASADDIDAGVKRLAFDAKDATTRLHSVADDTLDTAARVAGGSKVTGSPGQLRSWATERHQALQEEAGILAAKAKAGNQGQLAYALERAERSTTKLSGTVLRPGVRVDSRSFNAINGSLDRLEGVVKKAAGKDWETIATKLDDLDNKFHALSGTGQTAYRTAKLRGMPVTGAPRVADKALLGEIGEVNTARTDFRAAWGLGKNDTLNETAFRRFLNFEPDQQIRAASSLGNYQRSLSSLAGKLPDAELANSVNGITKELAETITKAVPEGAKIEGTALDVMTKLGLVSVAGEAAGLVPDLPGPADELLKLGLLAKFLKKGAGITKQSVGGSIAQTGARGIGYKAGAAVASAVGATGIPGFMIRSRAGSIAGGLLKGTTALSNAAGAVTTRVNKATTTLLKGVAKNRKAMAPGAAVVLNKFRFSMAEDDEGSRPRGGDLHSAFKARSMELARIVSNPMGAHQLAYDNLTPVRQSHALVADGIEMKAMEAAQFLYDKMPKDPGTVSSFGKSRWKPDESELIRWSNYVRAVADPVSVLEDAANGTVNPQGAEALRTVYPAIYAKAQETLASNVDQLQKNSTYDQRVRLSVLFGVVVDSSMSPNFTKYSQEFWANRASEEKPIDGAQLEPNEPTSAQKSLGPG